MNNVAISLSGFQRIELKVFRSLVRVYGRQFRNRYGAELESFFRADRVRERYAGLRGGLAFWRLTLRDLAAAAAREKKMLHAQRWSLETLMQDVGFGIRQIKGNPGFALTTILTLAIAIGANTAVFSVVNNVILRPLPYPEPHELMDVVTRFLPESGYEFDEFAVSPAEVVAYASDTTAMESVAAYDYWSATLTGDNEQPARVRALGIDDQLMPLLGIRPQLGRWFLEEEDIPNGPAVAIISHALWNSRYGRDPAIIGRNIMVDGSAIEVVGVMPEGFDFPSPEVVLYLPLRIDRDDPGMWGWHGINAIARIADGVTREQADAELEGLNAAWRDEFGHPQEGHFLYTQDLHGSFIGDASILLWLLMAVVILVLTIGAVNVAGLMLARGEVRAGEIWVRMALGAGRARVVRQMLTESLVLAGIAAALGLFLAHFVLDAIARLNAGTLPRMEGLSIDGRVLVFTLVVGLLTTLAFGLAPALQATSKSANDRRTTDSGGRKRARGVLVTAEVALSVVIVLTAALMGQSFAQLVQVDAGFEAQGRLTFGTHLPEATYPERAEVRTAIRSLLDELGAIPGVESAAYTSILPATGVQAIPDFRIQGRPEPAQGERRISAEAVVITHGYMEALGIEVVAGRPFEATDNHAAAPVALVNRAAADAYWPGSNPVGEFVGFYGEDRPWIRVVGVVDDVTSLQIGDEIAPQMYLSFEQDQGFWDAGNRSGAFVIHTYGNPTTLVPAARAAVANVDPLVALQNVRTAEEILSRSLAPPRLASGLLGTFAAIALLLALVGVHGVVAHSVARRTREIGIRQALGADRGRVLRLMIREGAAPAFLGLAIGLVAAFFVTQTFADLLYEIGPRDPATFVALPVILGTVAVIAAWLPSRRATRVHPVEALRAE